MTPRTALVGYVLVAALIGERGLPTVCPFRLAARRSCPLCGTSRAVARVARGDLRGSLDANPVGVVLLGWLMYSILHRPPWQARDHVTLR
ncbi:DUF2752 domain-containing protein [Pseudonocardia spinosispora]|uniref:DUF2752 domain-containing protein n=1 Tax=Pseudonocardia spinosispora TaxID=103441 RepID=UPI0003FBD66A